MPPSRADGAGTPAGAPALRRRLPARTTLFALTLTEEEPSAWTLTWTGVGAVYFPLLFLMAHRMLRKDSRARASREG